MKIPLLVASLTGSLAVAYNSAPAATAAAAAAPVVVHIKDFKYAPTPVTVHAGDTVEFINDDGEPHTITAGDKTFDSEGLDGSATWKHAFLKAGKYAYFCELHPYMKGTIVVLPAEKAQ